APPRTIGTCVVRGVAMSTASTSDRSSTSPIVAAAVTPNSRVTPSARRPPATATSRPPGTCPSDRPAAYVRPMYPDPITPKPTVIGRDSARSQPGSTRARSQLAAQVFLDDLLDAVDGELVGLVGRDLALVELDYGVDGGRRAVVLG